ncbi:hypothetical protein Gpo141_00003588 [Globisporangium polare]
MKTTTTTVMAMLTANEWDVFWMAWMLVFCAANGAAVVSCVAFLIANYKDNDEWTTANDTDAQTSATTYTPPSSWASNAPSAFAFQDPPSVCGKRKASDDEAFGMTGVLSQGKWKRQRHRLAIAQPSCQSKIRDQRDKRSSHFGPARAYSFGDVAALLREGAGPSSPLRRAVSSGNVATKDARDHRHFRSAASTVLSQPKRDRAQPLATEPEAHKCSLTANLRSQLRSFLVEKLRTAARNAVDEVLTSVFSFLTYATLLFLVRQYSAVAIGVSLDLGAFSIEL